VPFEKVLDLFIKAKTDEAQRIKKDKDAILLDWNSFAIKENADQTAKFTVLEGKNFIYPKLRQMIEETKKQAFNYFTCFRINSRGPIWAL